MAAMFATDRDVVIVGGRDEEHAFGDVWAFDIAGRRWRAIQLPAGELAPRAFAAAAQLDETAYMYGGTELAAAGMNDLLAIDLRTWTVNAGISVSVPFRARLSPGLTVHTSTGRLLLFGGQDAMGWHNDLWEFDPRLGVWSMLAADCVVGECPPPASGSTLLSSGNGDVPFVFAPAAAETHGILHFAWRTDRWVTSHEDLETGLRADCDGDGAADPGYGQLCAVGTDFWSAPGEKRCDLIGGVLACLGGQPEGVLAGGLRVPGAEALDARGTTVAVVSGSHLQIVDASDPLAPRRVGSVNVRGHARDVALIGDQAFIAAGSHVAVVDVARLDAPSLQARVELCGSAAAVAAVDGGTAVALSPHGLAVVSRGEAGWSVVSQIWLGPGTDGTLASGVTPGSDCAARPAHVAAACATGRDGCCAGTARLLDVHGSRAYVVRGRKLLAIDVSRPEAPRIIETVDIPIDAESLRVWAGFAYLLGRHDERLVVDVGTSPARIVGEHDLPEWVSGVAFGDGIACRLNRDRLEVADVDAMAADDVAPRGARVRVPGTPHGCRE